MHNVAGINCHLQETKSARDLQPDLCTSHLSRWNQFYWWFFFFYNTFKTYLHITSCSLFYAWTWVWPKGWGKGGLKKKKKRRHSLTGHQTSMVKRWYSLNLLRCSNWYHSVNNDNIFIKDKAPWNAVDAVQYVGHMGWGSPVLNREVILFNVSFIGLCHFWLVAVSFLYHK